MAAPFKLIIRVIIVIAAIWCLLNFLGLPGLRFR